MYRLTNIKIRENLSENEIIDIALKKYNINKKDVKEAYIFKRSIDARNKRDIFLYLKYCSFPSIFQSNTLL